MSQSEQQQETATDLAISAINNSISVMQSLVSKTRNIVYDSTLNKTKVYGHTNFEELNVLGNAVSLNGHTHKTNDITRDITETVLNDEEEEVEQVVATIGLNTILDDKADIGHTHAISDITNLQTTLDGKASSSHNHDSTYARLNNANTFTGVNTFTSTIRQINENITTTGQGINLYIGKDTTTSGNCGRIWYYYSTTNNGRYLGLGLNNYNGFKIYRDRIETLLQITSTTTIVGSNVKSNNETRLAAVESGLSNHTHSSADISNWATATQNFAKLDSANTFTGVNTFTNNIYIFDDNLAAGYGKSFYIGINTQGRKSGQLLYSYASSLDSCYFRIGLSGYPAFVMFYDRIEARLPISSTSLITSTKTIVGSNVKSDNETRLAACETALNGKASSSHTHAISNITDLQTTLDGKASSSHTHAISDITDLQTTLNSKANSSIELPIPMEEWSDIQYDVSELSSGVVTVQFLSSIYPDTTTKTITFTYERNGVETDLTIGFSWGYFNSCSDSTHFTIAYENSTLTITSSYTNITSFTFKNTTLNTYYNTSLTGCCQDMWRNKANSSDLQTTIDNAITAALERVYPVGSLYISMNSTDPSTVLGFGIWRRIYNTQLYVDGDVNIEVYTWVRTISFN